MTTLEDLVRETLADRARDVDGIDLTAPRTSARRGQRWVAIATIAAVAAAILVTIVLIAPWRGAADRNAVGVPTPPAGMQWVSFHGITLTVPASWTVNACASQDGVAPSPPTTIAPCSVSIAPPTSDASALGVTLLGAVDGGRGGDAVTVGGRPATELDAELDSAPPTFVSTVYLPDVSVVLRLTGRDRSAIDSVLAAITYTPADRYGCTAQQPLPTETSRSVGAAIDLGPVSSAVVCEYGGIDGDSTRLLGSRALDTADVDTLRTALRSAEPLPPDRYIAGVGAGGPHAGMHEYRLQLTNGSPLTVFVDLSGRPVVVHDDHNHWSVIYGTASELVNVPNAYPDR